MSKQIRSHVIAWVAVAAGTSVAAAQQDTAKMAPVVVTATLVPISAAASPATVTVITGDEIRLRGATTLAGALQAVPGLVFTQNGSFGALTSLFLRGGETKYVKVLVDGVPMNDPGGAMDFSAITTDNVERIEIVRGPASVLYGADAVTGVIQIFTRHGRGAPRTTVSARAGTYSSRDYDASVLGAAGSGDYSADIARHDTRGIYAFNNAYHNTVASGRFHTALDARTDLRVSLRYDDGSFNYPTNGGGTVVDTNARQSAERTTLGFDLGRTFTDRLAANLSLTSETSAGGTDDKQDKPTSSGLQSVDRTRRRGADLRGNYAFADGMMLTLGVQTEQQDERNETQSAFGTFQSTSVFQAARRNTAGYAQVLATLPDSIVLTAGARHDDNERFGKFDTYRAGASWRVLSGTQVRGSVGTAFREPSFFENYATGFVTGNPHLSPERTSSSELGLRQFLFADRLTLGVTHFDQRFRNMIDYTGSNTACGASYCNVARATSRGREFEARFAATNALSFDANLTHLETKVVNAGFDTTSGGLYHRGESLIRRPTTTWNLGGAYVSTRGAFDVRVTRIGERTDRDFRPFPAKPVVDSAYSITNVGGRLPLGDFDSRLDNVELTLRIENLFDKTYQSVFNFLSPRRTVLIGGKVTL